MDFLLLRFGRATGTGVRIITIGYLGDALDGSEAEIRAMFCSKYDGAIKEYLNSMCKIILDKSRATALGFKFTNEFF